MKPQVPRSRPTNNQLLYKAHFRWEHYAQRQIDTTGLQIETDPCASVTAAFLKVLGILQRAEHACTPKRNILQILANNTRRTKVLELSSGTHRIPDELKKHFLTDENGAQYSTNLDRNRYGSDNNYLFTVVKHDLEALGLCPCLVDVEIIDAKAHGDSQLVNAGAEACVCMHAAAPTSMPPPQQQGECSQLFEALVAAAADATAEQAEADTAAQDGGISRSRSVDQRPPGGISLTNGTPAAQSPGRAARPTRGATGIFSVNSSDLMGYGLSNLGNSGLVVGDMDLDRKDEVEQGPPAWRSKRAKVDADTISEQGDTDRYLKNVAADTERELGVARAPVPRQSSVVVAHNGTQAKDLRGLWAEMQALQRQQAQLESAGEANKRVSVECETVLGQVQRGIQALQEDRTQLKSTVTTLSARVQSLEATVQASSAQLSVLQGLLVGALSKDGQPPANGNMASALQQQLEAVSGLNPPQISAVVQLLTATAHAPGTTMPATASAGGKGLMGMPMALQAANTPQQGGAAASEQLAPIAQLQNTQDRLAAQGATPPAGDVLEGEPAPLGTVRFDDSDAIKKLPKFDNFGSLSDLGSLFSGGPNRSVDVRSGGRQAPRANLSISSPHPLLGQVKPPGVDVREDGAVPATLPTTPA